MKRSHIIIVSSVLAGLVAAIGAARLLHWVDFFAPWWLLGLLSLPVFVALAVRGMSGLPSHTNAISVLIRGLVAILIVLCLADMQIVLENDTLCALYLLDHSDSIPEEIAERELAYVNESVKFKRKRDKAGIVIFGDIPSIEATANDKLFIEKIYSDVGKDQTDIQSAVELATAAFPAEARKKIVLITDGNETKGSLAEGAEFAAANNVVIDVLPVTYEYAREVLVEKVHLPDKIKENETFDLKVYVQALQDCPAELAVYRNGVCITREKVGLSKGRTTYALSMKIPEPGFYAYTARIASAHDTLRNNNEASGYVYIQGASRVLLVAPTEREVAPLAQACRTENIETDIIAPSDLPESLGQLQNHDCIVLANVPADEFSERQMKMLEANVRDLGVGLMMIGGENSFGAGGYDDTPVEEALPVSMDIKQKKINPKGALVLVLHTCEFADGNYWAKQISKRAIETVNSQDEVGALIYSYNGGESWLFKLQPASNKKAMYSKIDQAMPGDMPTFAPTIKMAYEGLSKSDAMVKHVIIISDGDPAAPDPQVVAKMAEAGMTISTVAINPHSPRDVDIMKYLAVKTGGRYYFANDPAALPKIFVKEAKVVKRSLIFNEPFVPQLVLSTELTKGIVQREVPPLMAYVASTPKARALVPFVSENENEDPIFAYWRYGLGKSVAFTSDATSNWGKQWVSWPKYGKFWTQVVRWVSRRREESILQMRTEIHGGRGRLIIDAVDPKGQFVNFLKLNGRVVDPDNKGTPLTIRQTSPGRYEAEFTADKLGINIINVGYRNPTTGGQGFAALGVPVSYSPEYRRLKNNAALLAQAAVSTGGKVLVGNPETDAVFESSLPPTLNFRSIWETLLAVALCIFFFDIVIRRVIITREDIRSAWAQVLLRIRGRRAGKSDETMSALLRRKMKTAKGMQKRRAVSKDFKADLDRAAAGQPKGAHVEPESVSVEPVAPPTPAPGPSKPKAAAPAEKEEASYTSRLLAAKRRAQRKKQGDES